MKTSNEKILERKHITLNARMRAVKKSLMELEREAEEKDLPFIHRTNPIYKSLLRLSGANNENK